MNLHGKNRRWLFLTLLAVAALGYGMRRGMRSPFATRTEFPANPPPVVAFPLKPDSVRFAVIGDSGTGESPQYEVAQQMVSAWDTFPFDFAVMLGDNIYHGYSSRGFSVKFEQPYHVLLDVGVKFYASLGNHDDPSACLYKPFNMGGQRY